MLFNLYTLFNTELTHNTVLGGLLYLTTLESSWSSSSSQLRLWGMQPQFLHPLLADAHTSEGLQEFFSQL